MAGGGNRWASWWIWAALITASACSSGDDGADADSGGDGDGSGEAEDAPDADEEEWGPECVVDEDCDDEIDCTTDVCNRGICGNLPDDSVCQDDQVCNGAEVCYPGDGCGPGEPFRRCNDADPCTMDRCVEPEPGMAPTCEYLPLDRDADTHVDMRCGGDDCNDVDPLSNPDQFERCFDTFDNDCDGTTDLSDPFCMMDFDNCTSPRELVPGTEWEAFTEGATGDVEMSCDGSSYADVVFSFTIDAPSDVLVSVDGRDKYVFVALQDECGVRTDERRCISNYQVSIFERALPAGTYYVVVSSWEAVTFLIQVEVSPTGTPPPGDTCDAPIPLTLPARVSGDLTRMGNDNTLSCASWESGADMVYTFELDEASDVVIDVASPRASRYVALQSACDSATAVVSVCDSGYPFHRRVGNVPPGTYYLWVESEAPGEFTLDVDATPPTPPPANDTCPGAVDVSAGGSFEGALISAADDYEASCSFRSLDVAYTFTLTEPQAVSIVLTAYYDLFPYLVVTTECGNRAMERTCQWYRSPTSVAYGLLDPGTYYIVVEATDEGEFRLDVSFSDPVDPCEGLEVISGSGTFRGTTVGELDDFQTTCGGGGASPDVAYELQVAADSMLSATITAGSFDTVLHLRRVCTDPTSQVACDDDGAGSGTLSRIPSGTGTLPISAGTYYLVVDGFGSGTTGTYTLQVDLTPL